MLAIFSYVVAVLFFTNKVLVLTGRKSGWLLGAVASLLSICYFFVLKLYILTALQCGLVVLMGYGFFVKETKNQKVELVINYSVVLVMSSLVYFAFAGLMTVLEFFTSVSMLLGIYRMTHGKMKIGWLICMVGHLLTAYIMHFQKHQDVYAGFQVASAVVSYIGFLDEKRKSRAPQI